MKKKIFLFGSCLFIGCNYQSLEELENNNTARKTVFQNKPDIQCGIASLKQNTRWKTGETLKIKFLNGTVEEKQIIRDCIAEWLQYAYLYVHYVKVPEKSDINIGIRWKGNTSSSSKLGTASRNTPADEASMNIGVNYNFLNRNAFKKAVLHEFGHALGLLHEHQHPNNNIQWNKPTLYDEYTKIGWDTNEINDQIFTKLDGINIDYTAYDKHSIMHYSVPTSLTTNGYSVTLNMTLSAMDKIMISEMYPFQKNTKGFYRIKKGSRYYLSSGYKEPNTVFEPMGRIYTSQVANTLPIYSYFNPVEKSQLCTIYPNTFIIANGWEYEKTIGYAYQIQQSGTIPVYCYSDGPNYFYTTYDSEVFSDPLLSHYKYQQIAFYILL